MSVGSEWVEDDQQLVRYLLGLLPEEDAERLDEASIVDDDVAARLRCVENDLVDAYVAGLLDADTRARFESYYLSSPLRREKVRFAQRFVPAVNRAAESVEAASAAEPPKPRDDPGRRAGNDQRRARWKTQVWPAAIAALILVAVGAALQDVRLRGQLSRVEGALASSTTRQDALTRELDRSRSTLADTGKALDRARAALTNHGQPPPAVESLLSVALVLMPQTRAMAPVETVAIATDARHLPLELRLESNDYAHYQVLVKDAANNRIVWRSGILAARSRSGRAFVPVAVPVDVLGPQHYLVELDGLEASGRSEAAGSYAFLVER